MLVGTEISHGRGVNPSDDRLIWSMDGMILTVGTRNTRIKTHPNAIFFPTTNGTLSSLRVNLVLCDDKLATELCYGRNVVAGPNNFGYS